MNTHSLQSLRRSHAAMNTWFEAEVRGEDPDHLDAVLSSLFDEVDRVERLLSRFDPRSEVARVNREARSHPARVGVELFELLNGCQAAWKRSDGYFDVSASAPDGSFDAVELDEESRTVRFTRPGLAFDFGGIGKGYALDRAAEILDQFGVEHAFLHAGTSSVLALGHDAEGDAWKIGVRDPFLPPGVAPELFAIRSRDRGFSCSAVFGHNQGTSDVIDPRQGRPLSEPAACVALATSGAMAEVYSTALLAMGRDSAGRYSAKLAESGVSAAWIAPGDDGPVWEWINGGAT